MIRVAWYQFRATFGRRWGGYLTVVLLVGVVGGLAMGAVAGARRTQSSFPVYLASTNPSDLIVTTANAQGNNYGYDPVAVREFSQLPHVRHVESYVGFPWVQLLDPNGLPAHSGGSGSTGVQPVLVGSVDGEFFAQDRVTVIQGRMANPARANEIVLTAQAAKTAGARVGSVARLGFYSLAQESRPGGYANLAPRFRITAKVVGIVVTNDEVVQDITDSSTTYVLLTPAFTQQIIHSCPGCVAFATSGLQLNGGSRNVSAIESEVLRLYPGALGNFSVPSVTEAKAERAIRPESLAVGVFGGIAALAALVIVGQAIGRHLRLGGDDARTMRALGAGPAMILSDGLFGILGAVVIGSFLAVAIAIGLSPLFPLGPVRAVYPDPGIGFDWTVLGLGLAVLIGCLSAAAAVIVHQQAPHRVAPHNERARERTSIAAVSRLPPAPTIGVGFALDRASGRNTAQVRSVVLGAVLAMVVVIATVTFGASLGTLVSHPALYGWNWSYELNSYFGGGAGIPEQRAATVLNHDPYVAAWAGVYYGDVVIDGQVVPALGERPSASVQPPLLSGHTLAGPDQIVLGGTTLEDLHKSVGDSIEVNYGRSLPVRLRIVGTATMPTIGSSASLHTTMGTGALVSYKLVQGSGSSGYDPNVILVRLRGVEANSPAALHTLDGVAAALSSGANSNGPVSVLPAQRPAEIVNYRSMGDTPAILGVALAAGAAFSLGLTLLSAVRRRRRDLALLKALGFTGRQLASIVAWQSSVAVGIGTVVGVPLGIVLGRILWDLFAHAINVVPAPSLPVLTIVLIAVGALVLANVIATVPGRIAARTPTALLLRSE
jgi:hypothetical protein